MMTFGSHLNGYCQAIHFPHCHEFARTLSKCTVDTLRGIASLPGRVGPPLRAGELSLLLESILVTIAGAGLAGVAAVYVAAFGGICLHYVAACRSTATPVSLKAFGRHILPRGLLVAAWTRLDVAYAILDKILLTLVVPSVAVMMVLSSRFVQTELGVALGEGPGIPQTIISFTLFLICGLLIRDFAAFYVHLMQHRIPLLWEFHKVHHAPESLIPPTSRRLHPLDQMLGMAAEAPMVGLIVGVYAWLTNQQLQSLVLCALGFYYLANVVTFSPLRHSHIDLRLGRFEKFLLSPAHHRLHHSAEPAHWNKNFATIFPIWDRLFGTLVDPPPAALYRLGLPDGESARYLTLLACYIEPFRQIRDRIRQHGLSHMLRAGPVAWHAGAGHRATIAPPLATEAD